MILLTKEFLGKPKGHRELKKKKKKETRENKSLWYLELQQISNTASF